MLLEKIKEKLNSDIRFNYLGAGANQGVWATRKKGEKGCGDFIQLKKRLAGKGYGAFEVHLYNETDQGVEMMIEMYVPSHCAWNTLFEGFVENETDFDRIMVMLGLN
jgi:hypothetical protein